MMLIGTSAESAFRRPSSAAKPSIAASMRTMPWRVLSLARAPARSVARELARSALRAVPAAFRSPGTARTSHERRTPSSTVSLRSCEGRANGAGLRRLALDHPRPGGDAALHHRGAGDRSRLRRPLSRSRRCGRGARRSLGGRADGRRRVPEQRGGVAWFGSEEYRPLRELRRRAAEAVILLADGVDEVGRSVAGPSGASRDRLAFGGGLEYSRRRAVDRVLLPPNKPEAAPRTLRKRGRHGSSRLTLTRLPPPRPALQQLASR